MIYIFDCNTISSIFRFYYRSSAKSFWARFDQAAKKGQLISVREVRREIKELGRGDALELWADDNIGFFHDPIPEELDFIKKIYTVKHFRQNISKKQMLCGKPFADPFIIAKAKILKASVVTQEKLKPNAAQIPNICAHFKIKCYDLERFLAKEGWLF